MNDASQLSWIKRFWGHLSTINHHKLLVMKLCFKMGLVRQGFLHDLSKYTPIEFCSGVKYWQGNRSPIEKEKEIKGVSMGWLHHKAHNKHHWEYWMDYDHSGVIFREAPKHIVKEMVCDRVAACITYQKDQYTDASPLEYFLQGNVPQTMNAKNAVLLQTYLTWIKEDGLQQGIKRIRND